MSEPPLLSIFYMHIYKYEYFCNSNKFVLIKKTFV